MKGWIGFDLDGTLAIYDRFMGATSIGRPIPEIVEVLQGFLRQGVKCKIFTARVWHDGVPDSRSYIEAHQAKGAIEEWCKLHIGEVLEITNEKDYAMWALYDDRAIQVQKNTGRILGRPSFVLGTVTDP